LVVVVVVLLVVVVVLVSVSMVVYFPAFDCSYQCDDAHYHTNVAIWRHIILKELIFAWLVNKFP
jgi:hypothetical protein